MHNESLIFSLYHIGAVKFGDFTLKSGKQSTIYLDLRQIISYPDVLRAVSDAIWHALDASGVDLLCGVPYTALPIATCLSLAHHIPMVMRRKEVKNYGTKQRVEGAFHVNQSCIVIEDIITTGSSVLETAVDLTAAGLLVRDVGVLIDREQGGRQNLQAHGYRVHAAFTLKQILETLVVSSALPESERCIVNRLLHD